MEERPYQYVPLIALLILIENYSKLIHDGNFKLQNDLDKMIDEINLRFGNTRKKEKNE